MAPAGNPLGTGLITSLAQPGGNITGVSGAGTEMSAKNLELIRELVPAAHRVAVLANANDPFTKGFLEEVERGAKFLRIEYRPYMIRADSDYEPSFAAIVRDNFAAVLIQGSMQAQPTVDLALRYRLPTLSNQKFFVKAGALMSYSASYEERARAVAGYIDKIFKGAKPADLPVQQPTKYDLTINLKTAKALGLTVPPTLLARADEVIE
jgi:putative ABC transport system substrate-binding protein